MTMTGLEAFDTTVQKTDVWLKEIMGIMGTDSRRLAYGVLRAVLHSLRDRLGVNEAASLGAQLPMLVRGLYYDSWDPSRTPITYRTRAEFLESVRKNYGVSTDIDPEEMTHVVLSVMNKHLTEGEIHKVRSVLPGHIQGLWPE